MLQLGGASHKNIQFLILVCTLIKVIQPKTVEFLCIHNSLNPPLPTILICVDANRSHATIVFHGQGRNYHSAAISRLQALERIVKLACRRSIPRLVDGQDGVRTRCKVE
jgi:epoxyqueuosine reductase QueG